MAKKATKEQRSNKPKQEHSVPFLWPMAAAIELENAGLKFFQDNVRYLAESEALELAPAPDWATKNRILLNLETMRVRDFSTGEVEEKGQTPVIIDAPYAGHSSTIADYARGQSLVETLMASGLSRVLVLDWKSATDSMRNFSIDKYLAEINVVIDDLGGRVHLVGLCQGGWMSAMYASRFAGKIASIVLAGSPIDTDAGNGPIKKMAHKLPMSLYEELVASGNGRMLGQYMLAGWKNMHPGVHYLGKFVDLYEHIEDQSYIERTAHFERWYENPIDLPGTYYLQAIKLLFKENRYAKGEFTGLGKKLSLSDITCPAYLLAGETDEITTREQVFAAKSLLGTPKEKIEQKLVPGGHIGLFMGTRTLKEAWPAIGQWIRANG